MKITLLAVGNKMPRWVNDGYNDYAKRFCRDMPLTLKEIKPEKRASSITAQQGIAAEYARIIAVIPPRSKLVVLDEQGQRWTTVQLANALQEWLTTTDNLCFVIGGADGLSDKLKHRADTLLQLSAMTLPHGVARILLAEQLYRAISILNHHPYHRNGSS